jgi:hypothetical protein
MVSLSLSLSLSSPAVAAEAREQPISTKLLREVLTLEYRSMQNTPGIARRMIGLDLMRKRGASTSANRLCLLPFWGLPFPPGPALDKLRSCRPETWPTTGLALHSK